MKTNNEGLTFGECPHPGCSCTAEGRQGDRESEAYLLKDTNVLYHQVENSPLCKSDLCTPSTLYVLLACVKRNRLSFHDNKVETSYFNW